ARPREVPRDRGCEPADPNGRRTRDQQRHPVVRVRSRRGAARPLAVRLAMKTTPLIGLRLPPRVVIDFRDRHPIVIDPGRGTPATIGGHPAWVTTGRSRPRYFDGRFLAARDLMRDQEYFAARQQDELRAVGQGVVHGLDVQFKDATRVTLTAGIAITPDGQLVVLREGFDLEIDDIATTQRLDSEFGLLNEPRDVSRR